MVLPMSDHECGPARELGAHSRGWFVGPYQESTHPLFGSHVVEVKWGEHEAGSSRPQWDEGAPTWSLAILVSGDITMQFRDGDCRLAAPGDCVVWRPETPHSWFVDAKTVVITIRWRELPAVKRESNEPSSGRAAQE